MGVIDIVIIAVIILAVILALWHIRTTRKKGCSGCCAECNRACSLRCEKEDCHANDYYRNIPDITD